MRVRFLSGNEHKIHEATSILSAAGVEVVPIKIKLEELQTQDVEAMVRDKAYKAYHKVGYPLFVEQTGLYIDRLRNFPGGLTQVFWDTIGAERISELFGQGEDTGVIARTHIGYCNGKRIEQFEGMIRGKIADAPRGNLAFQWDCIFIPDGFDKTFAEMGDKKNEISMRRLALNSFASYLKENRNA